MSQVKPDQAASSPADTDRLDGWKEIAAHLRRSVRTVQRWERELSLPVRRIGSPGGEVVYAFRREIDEWLLSRPPASGAGDDVPRTTEEPGPTHGPLRGRLAWAGALAVAAIGVAWVWSASSGTTHRNGLEVGPEPGATSQAAAPAGPKREPARWEVADSGLAVLDHRGERVCTIAFDAPVELGAYENHPPQARVAADLSSGDASLTPKPLVQIADLDGDGRREVVVALETIDFRERSLAVYDARCRLRWKDTSQPSAVFGDALYDGPYHVIWVRVTRADDGRWVIWSSRRHSKYFPSVLQKFDAEGRLLGQFWNPGEITEVATGVLAGRESVVVGGVNNEFRQPFVAKYDADASVGVGPATSARYRCSSCPAGAVAPRAYVLFPNSELGALVQGMPAVVAMRLDHQWIAVEIEQYILRGVPRPVVASASYDLDANLVPVRADLSDGYQLAWQYLLDRGIVRRPFDPRQRARLWDVRVWDGSRFRAMPPSAQAAR